MDPLSDESVLEVDDKVRAVFEKYDKDGSGDIDSSELGAALDACGLQGIDHSMIEYMLRKYDGDRNATLDIFEFGNMVEDLRLNSTDSVKQRLGLRSNPVVLDALKLWRNTAWYTMEADYQSLHPERKRNASARHARHTTSTS
jgi:hypothetical protein